MTAKSEALGFKVQICPPGQPGSYLYKRFSLAESVDSISLQHIWSEIRSGFPSVPLSSELHGIYVLVSKDDPVQFECAASDQHLRSLIRKSGVYDKIRIECKALETEEESFVMINSDSSRTTPKQPTDSECKSTPSTAPRTFAASGGQLFSEPRGSQACSSAVGTVHKRDETQNDEINLSELVETFELYSSSVDDCKGKKAVVLFGETGCGKTSTSLFLLGARMVTKEDDGEENLALDDSDTSSFAGFTISDTFKAETKVINARCVDVTRFESEATRSCLLQDLHIADLPGFDDTDGPQSDISQCVTSLNAIKGMHSIWPVFLIPCDCFGSRGSVQLKMKPLVRLIGRIFAPMEDYIPSEKEMESGKVGHLHFLFTRPPHGKDDKGCVEWVQRQLSKLCDSACTSDLGGPDVTRLVKFMHHYVKTFIENQQSGLLVIRKDHLVSSGASDYSCATIKRITSANPIRDTPKLKCPLSEMTLSRLHTKVSEQASVIKNLFTQDPPQYTAACNTLQILHVISKAVCDHTVNAIFENALQFVGQQVHSLLDSTHVPMQSRDFDRLHAVMMTMKSCLEALRPHSVLCELYQEIDSKKRELCKSVAQIAKEARAAFYPADREWTPVDGKEENDRLQTLHAIERAFFAKGTHQFISQAADHRYPQVKKYLQTIVCKSETVVTDALKSLFDFAVAETQHQIACSSMTTSDELCSLDWPKPLEAFDTATALFKSLTVSKRIMESYDGHLTSAFLKLRDDFRRFLSETFQESLLSSYCHSIKSFHFHMFAPKLITCLDFLKELDSNSVLQMIERPGIYECEVSRIRQMCFGILGDIDSNLNSQTKQYGLVVRDLHFLKSFQSSAHAQQFLPHETHKKIEIIDRCMTKLCSDVKQSVEHFKDREILELRDCQKMVDLLKELYSALCLQPYIVANADSNPENLSISHVLDMSLDVLTSECKTRWQNFRHSFAQHDAHAVVCPQLVRLARMNPLRELSTIQNSANATPSIVTELHEQMKEITETIIFATADSHFSLNWQSLEHDTAQLEAILVSIQWLTAFLDRPQDRFAEMSGFGTHDCFINFVSMCQQRYEFLKCKLDEFKVIFLAKIEDHREIALQLIQTRNPATDIPLLKQRLDAMKEFIVASSIDAFLESIASKRYHDVIDKLKDKIATLVADTSAAFEKTNYECVTPNRDYFDRISLHISHHIPESVGISDIITRFSRQHNATTVQMRENLPQFLREQKFREIAVCLLNLQRTKDSEPNDKLLFEGFNDEISAYLADLHHSAEDIDGDDLHAAILTLRNVLEKSQRTLSLHIVQLSGRNVFDVFKDILKCCWDKFEELANRFLFTSLNCIMYSLCHVFELCVCYKSRICSTLVSIKKYNYVPASKSFVLLKKCKCFDPVLRSMSSELTNMIMGENQAKHFAAKIEDFKQQHIETLHSRIVTEFQAEGIDRGSSGYTKVAAIFQGVSTADLMVSTHSVLFDGILQFDDLSKELCDLVITACTKRLSSVATCTGQSHFGDAQEHLDCVSHFLSVIKDQKGNPKLQKTTEECDTQRIALDRARQNNVLKRFRFTSSEVPRCIELLNEQLFEKSYAVFEESWKALENTLQHEVGQLTALTSKPYSNVEEKDILRVFEVSSGIIRFGNEGKKLIDDHFSHLFRSMVNETPHILSSFVKKLLGGYESQLKNFVQLADLSNNVQKLNVFLQDSGLQCWNDAKAFVEKCSKISQRSEKAIKSVQEAISTVKEFDIKKYDHASVKKLIETLCHLRKQEKQEGHDCDFEDSDPNSGDSGIGKYQAVQAQLSTQIQATSKLQVKLESDHKIHRESFEQLCAAMTNCQVFESDTDLREIAAQERKAAECRLMQVFGSVSAVFHSFIHDQNFQKLDVLVSTGKELDSMFYVSFESCFPLNKSLLQHFCDSFKSLLDEKHKSFPHRQGVKDYAYGIIEIRQISTSVSNVSLPEVRSAGDNILKALIANLPPEINVWELGSELQAADAAGCEIVQDADNFPQFKMVKNAQFNKQTAGISIQHALTEMKKPQPDDSSTGRVPTPESECGRMENLLKRYQETEECLLNRHLKGYSSTSFAWSPESVLLRTLQDQAQTIRQTWQPHPIIDLLAGIGVVWTITTSGKEFWQSGRKRETLLRLHNVQVIGLIRLLKLSEEESNIFVTVAGRLTGGLVGRKLMAEGHMIQVGTGEGKSILLGVLSCFLAMTGIHVRCACYSQRLSCRDYFDFQPLFKKFNVESLIRYSTIDELAEECINEKGDIRSLALRHVGRSVDSSIRRFHDSVPSNKTVLLIDEVDVFFSSTFMGQSYNPTAFLGCDNTVALMKYIWNNRLQPSHTVISSIKHLPEYKTLKQNTFSAGACSIVDRELFNMIADAKAFDDPPYEVFPNSDTGAEPQMSVGYKLLDGMTTDVHYGYKTAFAWLFEAEKKAVPMQAAEKQLQFQIPCGRFSYASIPKNHFDCVLGVTGTLSCLTANERQLILDDYQIGPQHITYLPSLFGPSNMKFNGKDHIIVDSDDMRWQQTILQRINKEAVDRHRPILVFFESEARINEFIASEYGSRLPAHQIIVESTLDVPWRVSKATSPSQVTLLSRVFGRGVDFKVNDPFIESVDGVCVVCTFFPDSESEEIQIRGRAARQGKKGSFEFILSQPDLQRDFSATAEQLKDSPYDFLVKQRTTQTDNRLDAKKEQVKRRAPDHEKSMEFVRKVQQLHPQTDSIFQSIQSFLRSPGSAGPIHTIFCLDDSLSMDESWDSVKEAVLAFIEIRKDIGSPGDLFSCVQFSHSTHIPFQRVQIEAAFKQASTLTLRSGGTSFAQAIKAVSGLVQAGQEIAILFMTDGASSDNPIADVPSIMDKGAEIHFFGVAFTAAGKTQTFQEMVKACKGCLIEAANVKELRAQFAVIASDPTAAHAR